MLNKIINFLSEFKKLYLNKKMFLIGALGYGSGVPFSLIFITYTFNLAEKGINLRDIGLFGLAGLPFTIKFIWSPLVDGLKIPFLYTRFGMRRSWLILSVILLMIFIAKLAFVNPATDIIEVVYLAIIISFISATYDIAYDAIRVELLKEDEQGAGAGVSIMGYRIGMLMSGGIALILADQTSWQTSFLFMAATLAIALLAAFFTKEPEREEVKDIAQGFVSWTKNYIAEPFIRFSSKHQNWLYIIIFAILYKIGDALLSKMLNPFYLEMGFTKTEVAEITKFFGFIMTILGGIIGGWAVYKIGVIRCLFIFGILQAVSNLSYAYIPTIGSSVLYLTFVIAVENITGAMGTAAFVAYLAGITERKFTATQYALLTSFASLGRWITNAPSGYMVDKEFGLGLSWEWYFITTVIISIPGIVMVKWLKRG
ncbi:MAG TPA: hypothetical protein DIV86_01140 [Alphaproteobacteria bacterium]|nr:hypothetical protein [Alphaproteobacteria bacterium]